MPAAAPRGSASRRPPPVPARHPGRSDRRRPRARWRCRSAPAMAPPRRCRARPPSPPASAPRAPRARHRARRPADSRNRPAPRRPCTWRQTRRRARSPWQRSGDRRRSPRADPPDRAAPTAPSSRPDRRTSPSAAAARRRHPADRASPRRWPACRPLRGPSRAGPRGRRGACGGGRSRRRPNRSDRRPSAPAIYLHRHHSRGRPARIARAPGSAAKLRYPCDLPRRYALFGVSF